MKDHPIAQINKNHFLLTLSVKYPVKRLERAVTIEYAVPATKAYSVDERCRAYRIDV